MNFFEILKVIILGIVEGVTEWLPISSTGHLLLFQEWLELKSVDAEFMEMFNVVIQLGAICAVIVLYFKKLWPFVKKKEGKFERGYERFIDKNKFTLWFKIIAACIPLGVIGILFDDEIDKALMSYPVVAVALIVYGVLFLIIERKGVGTSPSYKDVTDITYKTAIIIGLFQVLSLVPGTSRSGVTIISGMLFGTSRVAAAEFTFYLGIPVMFGASLLKIVKHGLDFSGNELLVLVLGMVTAFAVSMAALKFLVGYIKKHNFKVFGWYRIVLGICVLGYFVVKECLK